MKTAYEKYHGSNSVAETFVSADFPLGKVALENRKRLSLMQQPLERITGSNSVAETFVSADFPLGKVAL